MLKKEMVDLIVTTLFNTVKVSGAFMERLHRGYMRLPKKHLEGDYNRALKINTDATQKTKTKEAEARMKKHRPYKALDHTGKPIITVLAQNAYLARGEVLEQLSRNPSRRPYKDVWRKGHCTLLTDTGIKLYWCHNMERFVTIPEGEE